MKLPSTEVEFLIESNSIEGVYDGKSFLNAVKAWRYLKKQKTLTVEVVLKTHELLMVGHLGQKERGNFRIVDVWVGGRKGMPIWEIRPYIEEWVKKANMDYDWNGIKLTHVAYEYCHPFIDGNGRTGRMFMNWARLKNGLRVKVIRASKRSEYYKWFN